MWKTRREELKKYFYPELRELIQSFFVETEPDQKTAIEKKKCVQFIKDCNWGQTIEERFYGYLHNCNFGFIRSEWEGISQKDHSFIGSVSINCKKCFGTIKLWSFEWVMLGFRFLLCPNCQTANWNPIHNCRKEFDTFFREKYGVQKASKNQTLVCSTLKQREFNYPNTPLCRCLILNFIVSIDIGDYWKNLLYSFGIKCENTPCFNKIHIL